MTKNINPSCPSWSPTSGNCKFSQEGLFIPLDDHVDAFCRSIDYCRCDQQRGEKNTEGVDLFHTVSERRQFDRHFGSQEITIIPTDEYIDEDKPRLSAQVMDFSQGGIRLLASKQLNRDTTVTCSFNDSFPSHLRSGAAVIRWCRPLLNSNGYQAGLSFRDERLSVELSSYLDHRPL